jgi:hypothetical protein
VPDLENDNHQHRVGNAVQNPVAADTDKKHLLISGKLPCPTRVRVFGEQSK